MPKFIDITGKTFNRLLVISRAEDQISPKGKKSVMWDCRCVCGTNITAMGSHLKSGHTQSCGCFQSEQTSKTNTKHGLRSSPIYIIWYNMIDRCENSSSKSFRNYGGRGITVCDRWKSFKTFLSDMGPRPYGTSIDRINNNGNYSPENCRWATQEAQHNNTRRNIFISHNGEILTMAQWSRKLGGTHKLVRSRLILGWSKEKAVTTPVNKK